MFENLRTDRGRDRYPEITYHRAPHKPFLLLTVMDLIAQGRITENLIEPSFDLVDTFNTYWFVHYAPWIDDQHGHEMSGVRQGVSALSESEQDNLRNDPDCQGLRIKPTNDKLKSNDIIGKDK